MSLRRSTPRVSLALIVAGVAAAVLVSSRPVVGQGGGASRVPPVASAQVPTVSVPSIAVPRVPPQGTPPPVQPATYLEPHRIEQLAQAVRMGVHYLPGEVIVKFKSGMAPADQNRALASMASHPTHDTIEWHSDFAIVRDASQPDAHIMAARLRSQPEVEYAEPNFFVHVDPLERRFSAPPPASLPAPTRRAATASVGRVNGVPNDTDYAAFQWNFSLLNMPSAWDLQPGGNPDLIVAVIDTGITVAAANLVYPVWTGSSFQTLTMPAIVNTDLPASRLTLAKDFIGTRISPAAPIADLDGHGTHVSGTIAQATNNGFLVSGIAYNVRIMPVKVCSQYWDLMIRRGVTGTPGFEPEVDGTCSNTDLADGIRYAVDQGARVLNISLGGGAQSVTVLNALQYAVSKGAFVALSMGNEFAEGDPIQYPAAYAPGIDGVMSVAAVGVNSTHASYSSSGDYCEIAAPGGDLVPARVDKGVIWQSTLNPNNVLTSLTVPRFDIYTKVGYTGTSMAAPHVAGLAALLMSQQPKLTGAQVEQIIKASALDIGTPGKDTLTGFGLIQPRKALFGQSVQSK